ncbi:hypothetical protein llap_10777 [Limosa lapponica baueri]|uniref:Uncharacterized protein n=1 Tax=Limosa lapponica baueri TaxID=1758121 RepID=A0A2I0TYT1_LIMLA|nr:hypothetical protein llap_10777 [Limosa lapponica baueri]
MSPRRPLRFPPPGPGGAGGRGLVAVEAATRHRPRRGTAPRGSGDGRAAHGQLRAAPGGGGGRRRPRRRVAGGGRRGFWGPVPQPGLERAGGAGALRDHAGAGLRRGAGAAGPAAAATRGAAAGAAGAVRGHAAAGLPPRPHLRPGRGGGRGCAAVRLLPRGQPLQPHVGARRRGHEPQVGAPGRGEGLLGTYRRGGRDGRVSHGPRHTPPAPAPPFLKTLPAPG